MPSEKFIPFPPLPQYTNEEQLEKSFQFYKLLNSRRTIREFSSKPIPEDVIDSCIKTANTAPSGANLQPWHFCVVSDSQKKREIRIAAEKEEHEFYNNRAPQEWLDALEPLGTDEHKSFLETAPILIAIFSQKYGVLPDGRKCKHYYAQESAGIATGMLISALHNAGLASLTHTPSPMKFLNSILNRLKNENPFLLLVVGYPGEGAMVPNIKRKTLDEIKSNV